MFCYWNLDLYVGGGCDDRLRLLLDCIDDMFSQGILKARVGRNVDGLDINLYHQTMQLVKQFQAEQAIIRTS